MTLESMIYIKKLLEEEVATRKRGVEKLTNLLNERYAEFGYSCYTPDEKVNGNVLFLRNARETQEYLLSKSSKALEEFLGKEW